MSDRYTIHAIIGGETGLYGTSNEMGGALALIKKALLEGATYAYQRDTRPEEDKVQVVSDEEREAMKRIMPNVP